MTNPYSNLLKFAVAALCIFFLWLASIAATYWDTSRRNLGGFEKIAWVVLAALVPGIGFAAYLLSRLFAVWFSPRPESEAAFRQRMTLAKPRPEAHAQSGTIAAADLVRPTLPEQPGSPAAPSAPPARSYHLAVIEGPHAGLEYALDQLPVTIGRGSEAQVRLDGDLGVSRQHAQVYQQAGVLRVRDLQSTHGTAVNGFSIADKSLDPGDRIRVGLSTLLVKVRD